MPSSQKGPTSPLSADKKKQKGVVKKSYATAGELRKQQQSSSSSSSSSDSAMQLSSSSEIENGDREHFSKMFFGEKFKLINSHWIAGIPGSNGKKVFFFDNKSIVDETNTGRLFLKNVSFEGVSLKDKSIVNCLFNNAKFDCRYLKETTIVNVKIDHKTIFICPELLTNEQLIGFGLPQKLIEQPPAPSPLPVADQPAPPAVVEAPVLSQPPPQVELQLVQKHLTDFFTPTKEKQLLSLLAPVVKPPEAQKKLTDFFTRSEGHQDNFDEQSKEQCRQNRL